MTELNLKRQGARVNSLELGSIKGSGGGGKGGGGSSASGKEDANNLFAKNVAFMIDILSEGPIKGLVDGMKSVLLNKTPLQNHDGSYNFKGISVGLQLGLPSQSIIPGFSKQEAEIPVGAVVKRSAPVVRTISNSLVDEARIKVLFNTLILADTGGNISGTSVTFKIEVQPYGGVYSIFTGGNLVVSGKTNAPYERSYRVPLPAGGAPWSIKITRITADSSSSLLQNEFSWASFTEIIDSKVAYDDTAIAALQVDGALFGNQLPKRAYDLYGLKVEIPSNYNPYTKVYTGIWDGTFVTDWTDCPPWILYGLLTNKRWGLGKGIKASQIDKWGLYQIAQYCDELVPDGKGGTEPRYTFNGVLNSRSEAYSILNAVVSNFRGMIYWGAGAVYTSQDAPKPPKKLVTAANVIDGNFDYSGSGLKSRHTRAIVTYSDPDNQFENDFVIVDDPELIQKYGYNPISLQAFGCTSRGQAWRLGKWTLETEKVSSESVTYKASWDHADVRPGDIVLVADPAYAGVRNGGRLLGTSTKNKLFLDSSVVLETGQTYTVKVSMPNGDISEQTVTTGVGTSDALDLAGNLADFPLPGALFVLVASNLEPRRFQVISMKENEDNIFEVMALLDDPTKDARIEQGISINPKTYTSLFINTPEEVQASSINFTEYLYLAGLTPKSAVTISWSRPNDASIDHFLMQMKGPNDAAWVQVASTKDITVDVQDTYNGTWGIRVASQNALGNRTSDWAEVYVAFSALLAPPGNVSNLSIAISQGQCLLSWTPLTALNLGHYEIRFVPLGGSVTWATALMISDQVSATASNAAFPVKIGTYLVKGVTQQGVYSVGADTVSSEVSALDNLNIITTLTEEPSFAGTFDRVVKVGSSLLLDSPSMMSDWTHMSDITIMSLGSMGFYEEGYYYFANSLDLGSVYTSQVSVFFYALPDDLTNVIATWLTLASVPTLSGAGVDKVGVTLQVRTTSLDPLIPTNFGPWQDFAYADYQARAFEFRLHMESFQDSVTPLVTNLSVRIDMPDRVVSEHARVCPLHGETVLYDNPFKETPSMVITMQGANVGDQVIKSAESALGFTVNFKDVSGTDISKTYDYQAKGYGTKVL